MASKKTFNTKGASVSTANTRNEAGGKAYSLTNEASLAQYVVTSCFNNVFYASAEEQVDKVIELANKCSPKFIAQAAVYAHENGKMKDAPALLAAVLTTRGAEGITYLRKIFPRVMTRSKMIMNYVQIIRSGKVGRRSLGYAPKNLIAGWLNSQTGNQLFTGSIGADPSLADIIKLSHPRPVDAEHDALFGYLINKQYDGDSLPTKVQHYEYFKAHLRGDFVPDEYTSVPDVPFQMIASLEGVTEDHWKQVARNLPWNALRMNLNTLNRHGVFKDTRLVDELAKKLADPEQVRRNNAFPYQLLTSYQNTTGVPMVLRNALQDAMEVACENLPDFGMPIAIAMDTSGSMSSAVTGFRTVGSTTVTRCVDIAGLVGAGLARKNRDCYLLPFDTRVHPTTSINPRDSIVTNADKLARFGGGGTDCSSAMRHINSMSGQSPQVVIFVSDNMSWADFYRGHGTGLANEWANYVRKTPNAKLVLIDIQPYASTQVQDSKSVLNIGGFSDAVWPVIEKFVSSGNTSFVDIIKGVTL